MYNKNCLFFLFGLFLLLNACANPIAPQGGPKDETPPTVVKEKSTQNFQTNFSPKEIVLTFDEWVKLKDAQKQVIISPPLQGYTLRMKGKSVLLDLGNKDTLRSNATYVVQFGEAIQDLTESNAAENLKFVFSTGPFIDSLEVQGQVLDAYTNEPVDEALVMLYDNLADTVVRTERPFYFGRTNENGQFVITNVREGRFKVFALKDADGNYRFNQASETIGFLEKPIDLSYDSVPPITIRFFQEELPIKRLGVDSTIAGELKITYNQDASKRLNISGGLPAWHHHTFEKDTLLFWYQSDAPFSLYLSCDSTYADTFRMAAASKSIVSNRLDNLTFKTESARSHHPGKALEVQFSRPINHIDTGLIRLTFDSVKTMANYRWELDSLDARKVYFYSNWKERVLYEWMASAGGVVDEWGLANQIDFIQEFSIGENKKLGNYFFRFSKEVSQQSFIAKLVNEKKETLQVFYINELGETIEEAKGVSPGDYTLEIILDENKNNRWDAGKYDYKTQPEKVIVSELETLRANWDVEVEVELDQLFEED